MAEVQYWLVMEALVILGIYEAYAEMKLNQEPALMSQDIIDTLEWGAAELPPDAQLVILHDGAVVDWTPFYLERTILNMPFGTEWEPAEWHTAQQFNARVEICRTVDCVIQAARMAHYTPDYIILSSAWNRRLLDPPWWMPRLPNFLVEIEVVYANDGAIIARLH